MTTLSNPSRFLGLPWESWTNSLGRTCPLEDKPPETKHPDKNKAGVMKLPKKDMKIFSLCPERDPFTVVVCEVCNKCVKPQALLAHFEKRHIKDNTPAQPPVVEVTVPEKPTTKVVKAIVKNSTTKVKTKKTSSKDGNKSKEGVVNNTPSLPVSLSLEGPLPDPAGPKVPGEAVSASSDSSKGVAGGVPPASPAPAATTAKRRPPRKQAPIKEREYDPDKHCGVVPPETMKPCTWSLTCKSHPMSLRRAVTGRSKPFDQLLADHRQAKEALLKQKKNLEQQQQQLQQAPTQTQSQNPASISNSSVLLTTPPSHLNCHSSQSSTSSQSSGTWTATSSGSSGHSSPKVVHPHTHSHLHPHPRSVEHKPVLVPAFTSYTVGITLKAKPPELSLDVTPLRRVYLSASPPDMRLKSPTPVCPVPAAAAVTPSTSEPSLAMPASPPPSVDMVPFTLNHPKPLNAPLFSNHKIGGLVYTNRRMRVARQSLELFLPRPGSSLYATPEPYSSQPAAGTPSATLSNVLNNMSSCATLQKSKAVKRPKPDKPSKPSKKICVSKEPAVLNIQLGNLKSVLTYPNATNRLVPTTNTQFHLPNIIGNTVAVKRPAETSPADKRPVKKPKKSTPAPVLSNHSKNGLGTAKAAGQYVRVAISNGKVDSDAKSLGLCDTPKFSNSNKILNETDLRKIGLRFEIFE